MFGLRLPELLLILAVVVLLFGAKKLPDLGEALGKGIRSFKKAAEHGFDGDDEAARGAKSAGDLPQASATTTPPASGADKDAREPTRRS